MLSHEAAYISCYSTAASGTLVSYWTSGNDLVKEGHWVWANNAEMSYNGNYNGCHHYENLSMQYSEKKWLKKMKFFTRKILIFFLFLLQNIDCGYSLEPPRRGGSNEYPQSMFCSKNKKNRCTLHTPVLLYKSWVKGGIHDTDMFS